MLNKKVILGLIAGAAVVVSSAALADVVAGPYAGVQLGYGDNHANYLDGIVNDTINIPGVTPGVVSLDPTETITNASLDHSAFAGRLYAGYDFNQYFAAEAGYTRFANTNVNFNTFTTDLANGKILSTSKISGRYETQAVDLVGKVRAPLADGFGVYAKAGADYLDTKVSIAGGKGSEKNIGLVYGLGTDYQLTPHLVADVSFTRFNGDNDPNSNHYQPNADLYAAGLTYKFNA